MDLYHFGFSTCSQKVRLVLAEKALEFESHEVNLMIGEQHQPEYVELNPNHVVPTLVHDGQVFIESNLIIRYLDDAFPETSFQPDCARDRYASNLWLKRTDEELHPAAPIVTFAVGPRNLLLEQPEEMREANINAIPDPDARETRRNVIEHGVHASEFGAALGVFISYLEAMESALATRSWLCGEEPGPADAAALPYVLRLEHLAMDPLISKPKQPRVADWLARWKARPSYATAVDAWTPPLAVEMLRKNGEALWPEIERIAASSVTG